MKKIETKDPVESAEVTTEQAKVETPKENCQGIGSVPLPGSGGGKGKTEKK